MDPAGFHCLGDEDTVRGFRGVGVPGEVVTTAAAAARAFATARARPGPGILILTEPVADWLRPEIEALRLDPTGPLIAEIPGPDSPPASTAHLSSSDGKGQGEGDSGVEGPRCLSPAVENAVRADSRLRRSVQAAAGFNLDWKESGA